MNTQKNFWKSLLKGEQHVPILDTVKIIFQVMLMIYLFHGIFFFIHEDYVLATASIITLVLGFVNLRLFKSNRFALSIILMDIELLVIIIITSLFLNFNNGFNLYALALIPFTYFVSFSLKKSNQFVLNPIPLVVSSCIVFISSTMLQELNLFQYKTFVPRSSNIIYFSNAVGAVFIIIYISSIYSKRTNFLQHTLEQENTKLGSYANKDTLTGLQNRRAIEKCLSKNYEKANNESHNFSLLLCDVDNFKKINDSYGHLSGDKVLKDFSTLIGKNIREFDCASRWGGEEFMILVKGGIPIATLIAERIIKAANASTIHTDAEDINYTVTIGIATYKKGQSIEDLIEEADENLYLGKRSGKNCYMC